jgi:hypothetical protein
VDILGVSSIDPGVCWLLDVSSRLLTIKITSGWWDGALKKILSLKSVVLKINKLLDGGSDALAFVDAECSRNDERRFCCERRISCKRRVSCLIY